MTYNLVSSLLFSFFFLLQFTCNLAQAPKPPAISSPPAPILPPIIASAPAPGPPGPPNVVKILGKAGSYSTFIKLLQITQEVGEITSLLNNSNSITMFIPSDGAFLNLKTGTLNSFSDQRKAELVKFHFLPSYFSLSQFQTASNPLNTQAAIYQVDKVLLPLQFFAPPLPPAPALAPSKPKKDDPSSDSSSVNGVPSGATSLLPHMFWGMLYPGVLFYF
ncbi:hypothetical protein KY289_006259 [Solanum tuberosum]|nr:hypothetical protein KY284_005955 [Solanum tuberosum]KAH0723215.1 hypothetical protein KY289_006259 [Solanum tuberosum]